MHDMTSPRICVFSAEDVTDSSQPVQSAAAHPGGHQARCCGSSCDVGGELDHLAVTVCYPLTPSLLLD